MRQRLSWILMAAAVSLLGWLALSSSEEISDLKVQVKEVTHAAPQPIYVAMQQQREMREAFVELETEIARDRLTHLPDDATQWHTSLFVQPDWQNRPAEKAAVDLFTKQPELVALKQRTHWHFTLTNDAIYQQHFEAECPLTPCLLVTRADGSVIYKESGAQLGTRPRNLWHAVRAQIRRHCPDGKCLPPLRFPDSPPEKESEKESIPDTQPEAKQEEDLLPMIVCGCAGFLLVLAVVLKRDLTA